MAASCTVAWRETTRTEGKRSLCVEGVIQYRLGVRTVQRRESSRFWGVARHEGRTQSLSERTRKQTIGPMMSLASPLALRQGPPARRELALDAPSPVSPPTKRAHLVTLKEKPPRSAWVGPLSDAFSLPNSLYARGKLSPTLAHPDYPSPLQ
jgi:hypothetical protein